MKQVEDKTMVMKILDKHKIQYHAYNYLKTGAISGKEVVEVLNEDPKKAFKTLVTIGKSGKNYVYLIPVLCELDLKKAASCVGEKHIEMIKSKDLMPLTGYVHGGCSPIGMKKYLTTITDKSALEHETIFFSAGKMGYQIEMSIVDLKKVIEFELADLTNESEK